MRVAVIRHGVGREADKVLPFLENGIYKEIKEINNINLEFFYLFREIKNENSILNNEKKVTSSFAKLDYEKLVEVNLPKNNYKIDFQSIFVLCSQCDTTAVFLEVVVAGVGPCAG